MKIYTRTGDAGQTGLFNGARVPKNHLRIETYGAVDELNSFLGLAIVDCPATHLRALLQTLQHQLFDLGADLATPLDSRNAAKVSRIGPNHILFLENQIDAATDQLPPLKNFILPGGTLTAARLHVARTIARRAERFLVTLNQTDSTGEHPLIYLNRLSDLLFTLARLVNHLQSTPDVDWHPQSLTS